MKFSEYKEQVRADAIQWLREDDNFLNYGRDCTDDLYDALFIADEVTGNGSGSYTYNAHEAEMYARDLIFDDDFRDLVIKEYGYTLEEVFDTPEGADVRARCFALDFVIDEIVDAFADLWDGYEAKENY